jgi:4'-phosphopantetheinyl transferase
MISWIDSILEWDRSLPAVLITRETTAEQRRALLRELVVRSTGRCPDAIAIAEAEGRPPVVVKPDGSGLYLSLGRRGPCAAIAIAASSVGVDVELADEAGEIPWNVLHHQEAAHLAALQGVARALAFARLWSLKEAYLKALGVGLFREPSSFAVMFRGEEDAAIQNDSATVQVIEARTTWRVIDGARAAISALVMEKPHDPGSAAD